VPILHETHSHETNEEEKAAVIHELLNEAIVKEMHVKPTIVETVEKTVIIDEGETETASLKLLEKKSITTGATCESTDFESNEAEDLKMEGSAQLVV